MKKTYHLYLFIVGFFIFDKCFSINNPPDTVIIGAYVSSLYDIDISGSTIKADIHYWCLYNDSTYNFEKEFEFINCDPVTLSGTSIEDINQKKWFYTKAIIQSRQVYFLKNYPFDKQKIIISVESSEHTTDDFVFKADDRNVAIDTQNIYKNLNEWEITNVDFIATQTKYNSSFGDPESNFSISPRFDIVITLKRLSSWFILFKLITGIIVAFLIAICVFWIKPTNTDPRFGLPVGGLFAAIGNKYIVESIIPATNELTLLDYLHNITFIFIFLIIILSVISLAIYEKEEEKYQRFSEKMDKVSFYSILLLFVFSFTYFIVTFH